MSVTTLVGACIGSIGLIHQLWGMMAVLFTLSAAAGLVNVQLIALLQPRVSRDFLGRVMSVVMFAGTGLMPVSLAVAGFTMQRSVPGMFAGAGILLLLVTLIAATQRSVREID